MGIEGKEGRDPPCFALDLFELRSQRYIWGPGLRDRPHHQKIEQSAKKEPSLSVFRRW